MCQHRELIGACIGLRRRSKSHFSHIRTRANTLTRKRPLVQSQYRPPSFTRSADLWRRVITLRQGAGLTISLAFLRPSRGTSGLVRRLDTGQPRVAGATPGASPRWKRSPVQSRYRPRIYRAECRAAGPRGDWPGDYRPLQRHDRRAVRRPRVVAHRAVSSRHGAQSEVTAISVGEVLPLAPCRRRQIIDTAQVCGRGLVSPTDLDVRPEGILWLASCRADR